MEDEALRQSQFDRRQFLGLAGASLALPSLAHSRNAPPAALAVPRQMAIDAVRSRAAPSVSVAVYKNGQRLWVEAFGWADREQFVEATPATIYAIASATKPFTATAMALLCGQRQIGLGEPIGRYLPGLDAEVSHIPFAQLLQHRSGIPRHWRNTFTGQGEPADFDQVVRTHAFTTPARSSRYLYSNLNYGLLARAMERITGARYFDHLRRSLLVPLGLSSVTSLQIIAGHWIAARPYEEDGSLIPDYRVDEQGARDLAMTASDLARFGQAHLAPGRAFAETTGTMLSERSPIPEEGVGRVYYGLGWMIEDDSPAALFNFGHTGEGPGAASSLTVIPSEQLVVATVANAQGPPAYRINAAVVDALSPAFAARRRAHPFQQREPQPGSLAAFTGTWLGAVDTSEGAIPLRLAITGPDSATFALGDASASPLAGVSVDQDMLSARANAKLPGAETNPWPHSLRLSLERTGAGLEGTLAAYASREPLAHDQFWLSFRTRLRRSPPSQ